MPPAPGHGVHTAGESICGGHQGIHECRLPDPGVTDEHCGLIGQGGAQVVRHSAVVDREHRDVEWAVEREQFIGRLEVGLGEHEHRLDVGVEGRNHSPVDQTGARLRIRRRGDDGELGRVGDDDPLDRIRVIGGASQRGSALLSPHDASLRVDIPRDVSDGVDEIAHDDALAAELARLDGVQLSAVVLLEREAAAIDGHHHRSLCLGVFGSLLRAGPRLAAPGADPDVVLVEMSMLPRHAEGSPGMSCPRKADQRLAKSGIVLPVVAMSSTSTPGTTSPRTAPAVAMRWSP